MLHKHDKKSVPERQAFPYFGFVFQRDILHAFSTAPRAGSVILIKCWKYILLKAWIALFMKFNLYSWENESL